jgi:hypothetical protein
VDVVDDVVDGVVDVVVGDVVDDVVDDVASLSVAPLNGCVSVVLLESVLLVSALSESTSVIVPAWKNGLENSSGHKQIRIQVRKKNK